MDILTIIIIITVVSFSNNSAYIVTLYILTQFEKHSRLRNMLILSKSFIIILLCNLCIANFIINNKQNNNYQKYIDSNWNHNNRISFLKLLLLRGGKDKKIANDKKLLSSNKDNDIHENEEEEDYDNDEQIDHSKNIPLMNTITDIWSKTPPITQIYIGSSMLITILSFILNKNKWPEILHFDWKSIITGQIWRLYTSFLFLGQLDMFYPLTVQFVWQHMSQLEKLNYNKPEEFLIMLLFGASTLITLYSFLGISMKFLGHNLATFLVYIWSRVFEGSDINFMDIITLKSEMLPWFFCAQTFLLEREIPFADLIGIVVGHFYHYLSQKHILVAPAILKDWFSSDYMKLKYARFKNDFE